MYTNVISMSIIDDITKCIKKFHWNKVDRTHYIPLTNWSNVCLLLKIGDLGIRNLKSWNLCFMAELGWKILTQPTKLWVRILLEKYCKGSNFLDDIPMLQFHRLERYS